MRDKVKGFGKTEAGSHDVEYSEQNHINRYKEEAESALIALGYKPQDAAKAIQSVKDETASTEKLIKAALKSMV